MMKNITISLMIIALVIGCRSSKFKESHGIDIESIPIEIKNKINVIKLKKSLGVIFPKEYEPKFNIDRLSNRFTPTEKEIRAAEIEINDQYLESDKRFIYNQVYERVEASNGDQLTEKQTEFNNFVKVYKKEAKRSVNFDRQYIGFIEKGQKNLVIQFLDFNKDPYGLKQNLTDSFIMGWHGWFETNVRLKEYNIEMRRLNNFGWPQL